MFYSWKIYKKTEDNNKLRILITVCILSRKQTVAMVFAIPEILVARFLNDRQNFALKY